MEVELDDDLYEDYTFTDATPNHNNNRNQNHVTNVPSNLLVSPNMTSGVQGVSMPNMPGGVPNLPGFPNGMNFPGLPPGKKIYLNLNFFFFFSKELK